MPPSCRDSELSCEAAALVSVELFTCDTEVVCPILVSNVVCEIDALMEENESNIQTTLINNDDLDLIFKNVKESLVGEDRNHSNNIGINMRQKYYRYYGFTGGQSHESISSGMLESGISKTLLLQGSMDILVVHVFNVVNKIIEKH